MVILSLLEVAWNSLQTVYQEIKKYTDYPIFCFKFMFSKWYNFLK